MIQNKCGKNTNNGRKLTPEEIDVLRLKGMLSSLRGVDRDAVKLTRAHMPWKIKTPESMEQKDEHQA